MRKGQKGRERDRMHPPTHLGRNAANIEACAAQRATLLNAHLVHVSGFEAVSWRRGTSDVSLLCPPPHRRRPRGPNVVGNGLWVRWARETHHGTRSDAAGPARGPPLFVADTAPNNHETRHRGSSLTSSPPF